MPAPLLQVKGLCSAFDTDEGRVTAVDGVSFEVHAGKTLGIVGESGCGKSVTAMSILRLLPQPMGVITGGEVLFEGQDLVKMPVDDLRKVRGNQISMVFQEPMTALNPVQRIGQQLSEGLILHKGMDPEAAILKSVELLGQVGIPSPEIRAMEYPHQLSGGMRQRVVIAIALACGPKLVIADEPTTALDVTIQAQILDLIRNLQRDMGMGMILITHDLGVIAETCDEVCVMYAGRIVERAPVEQIFNSPRHAYTQGLLASIPRLDDVPKSVLPTIEGIVPSLSQLRPGCRFAPRSGREHGEALLEQSPNYAEVGPGHWVEACPVCTGDAPLGRISPKVSVPEKPMDPGHTVSAKGEPLLSTKGLKLHFPVRSGVFQRATGACRAVDGVDLEIRPGETLGLVGESGCGKSTLGKTLARLYKPTEGSIRFDGQEIAGLHGRGLKALRREVQMIFQDPYESLNPRQTVANILEEPYIIHKMGTSAERTEWVAGLLDKVGLPQSAASRFPFEFSGGQRQRIGVARALALKPRLIICDEAVSALDVSIQGQILNLLQDLQREFGLAYLFISHDLAVVKHVSDRIAIMYLGKIVETADAASVYATPAHPYTQALLSSVPQPDPSREVTRQPLSGDVPSPIHPPSGCAFHTRCPKAFDECSKAVPALRETGGKRHWKACYLE